MQLTAIIAIAIPIRCFPALILHSRVDDVLYHKVAVFVHLGKNFKYKLTWKNEKTYVDFFNYGFPSLRS